MPTAAKHKGGSCSSVLLCDAFKLVLVILDPSLRRDAMRYILLPLACSLLSLSIGLSIARAGMHTQNVEYKQDDTVLEGFLAYDDSFTGKRPGVLVVHEWTGLGPYREKALWRACETWLCSLRGRHLRQGHMTRDPRRGGQGGGHLYKRQGSYEGSSESRA